MDFSTHWKQFLSECPEITGGALLTTDGMLISDTNFGDTETREKAVHRCAAIIAIAHQLADDTQRGEFQALIFEGEYSYLVLMAVLDRAIFAVLALKQAKLGLVLLDMRRAIDDPFGPGLAADPILSPLSPQYNSAYVRPEHD
jgi:uncharacterized protein